MLDWPALTISSDLTRIRDPLAEAPATWRSTNAPFIASLALQRPMKTFLMVGASQFLCIAEYRRAFSPSPQPSPSGRGEDSCTAGSSHAPELRPRSIGCSLSPRERVGVRGKRASEFRRRSEFEM